MSDSKWTTEQLRAITERGRNILVSAGAGSGKTAVMVERAVRLIMQDRVPVQQMLIVTFTKAAASEMKERLRKALKDRLSEIAEDVSAVGEQTYIKEQLDQLHNAQISTFHSFAQRVLKEFFYFTDIEPGFRVLDEPEAEVLKEQAMEELFDSEYETSEPDFIAFLDAYSGEKNDTDARDMIRELYRELEAVPDRFSVLDQKVEELSRDVSEFKESGTYAELLAIIDEELEKGLMSAGNAVTLLRESGLDRLADMVSEDAGYLELAKDAIKSGDTDAASRVLGNAAFCRIAAKGNEEKELYTDEVKSTLKAMREDYKSRVKKITGLYYAELPRMVRSIRITSEYAATLARLEKKFCDLYRDLKNDMNGIDYSDMEHYAFQILSHEEASSFYRDAFRYIFVDEYQDTNIMQETIISMIKRDDNLFMVGDIKQSIYHFRLADPDIFKAKYQEYKAEGMKGDDASSIKIDLNRNFRSKSKVLSEINKMFRPIMDGYDKDAELIPGAPDGEQNLMDPETHIVDIAGVREAEDEELADMQKEELEAREAVRIIRSVIGKEYTDSRSGEVKKVDYRDIVILMRSFKRSAEGYRDVFRNCGIPLFIDDRSGYFDSIEINVFMSLLAVIDNKRQDVPFIALLRSEIFGFTCTELATIRKLHMKGSFVDAAEALISDESAPEELREKCGRVFDDIRKWQAYAVTIPLSDLIWRLMNETGYYMTCGTLPDGSIRQANLRLLADRARDYQARSLGSLYGFIQYIDKVKSNKVDMPQAALLSENDNVVRIMTVHHSKGLEFPVVILAGMDNSHGASRGTIVAFDREAGLGIRAVDPEHHFYEDGIISRIIKEKEHRSEVDELKRVFYVAVTRARETFFLLGAADYDKIVDGIDNSVHSDSTLMKMSVYLPDIVRVTPDELKDLGSDEKEASAPKAAAMTEAQKAAIKRLEYEYPYSEAGDLTAKTSVTGLNKAEYESVMSVAASEESFDQRSVREMQDVDENRVADESVTLTEYNVPEFIRGKAGVTAAERGTAYHGVMERLDFDRAESEGAAYIESEMARLREDGVFSAEELESVDTKRIAAFFDTGLGKRAASACRKNMLYKEQTFESKIEISGEDVLVQGVIDCFFEEPDGIVLLDYKTNFIDRSKNIDEEVERIISMYQKQLDIYSDALKSALGKTVKEKYLYLFSIDREVEVR